MINNLNFSQHKYLNSDKLSKDFKKSYLTSLELILDDEKFKEKSETLPLLKSSVINKYEKMLAKKKLKIISQKKNKLNNIDQKNNDITNNKKQEINNFEKYSKKIITTRYILLIKINKSYDYFFNILIIVYFYFHIRFNFGQTFNRNQFKGN